MSNALKEGLVAHYPLQSNAVNMVDGVAGTIKGTPSWRKNHAGKVVLDDTTASVTHDSHAINTVTYWKDGKFYAVLNGTPYMVDGKLNSSFVTCASQTFIGCGVPSIRWNLSNSNLVGTTLKNSGILGSTYDLIGYNTTSSGTIIAPSTITVGATTVPAQTFDGLTMGWSTPAPVPFMQNLNDFVCEQFIKLPADLSAYKTTIAQRNGTDMSRYWNLYPVGEVKVSYYYKAGALIIPLVLDASFANKKMYVIFGKRSSMQYFGYIRDDGVTGYYALSVTNQTSSTNQFLSLGCYVTSLVNGTPLGAKYTSDIGDTNFHFKAATQAQVTDRLAAIYAGTQISGRWDAIG